MNPALHRPTPDSAILVYVDYVTGLVFWAAVTGVVAMCTLGFSWLVLPFIYNGLHLKRLFEKGFRPDPI